MRETEVLAELKKMTKENIAVAKHINSLSAEKKHQSSDAKSWNALQCFRHLNLYSEFYLNEFKTVLDSCEKSQENHNYKEGFWGKKFNANMLPSETMKTMNTFKDKNPSKEKVKSSDINTFVDDQNQLLNLLDQASKVNLMTNNCSITIPLLKMRLGDTLRFYTYHNVRHVSQAKKAAEIL